MSKPIDLTAINRLLENEEAFDKRMTPLVPIQFDTSEQVFTAQDLLTWRDD